MGAKDVCASTAESGEDLLTMLHRLFQASKEDEDERIGQEGEWYFLAPCCSFAVGAVRERGSALQRPAGWTKAGRVLLPDWQDLVRLPSPGAYAQVAKRARRAALLTLNPDYVTRACLQDFKQQQAEERATRCIANPKPKRVTWACVQEKEKQLAEERAARDALEQRAVAANAVHAAELAAAAQRLADAEARVRQSHTQTGLAYLLGAA